MIPFGKLRLGKNIIMLVLVDCQVGISFPISFYLSLLMIFRIIKFGSILGIVVTIVLRSGRTVKPRNPTWPWMTKATYEYTVFMKVNANKIIILPETYFLFINVYQVYTWYYLVILGTRAYHTHDGPISICLSQNFSLWYRVTFWSTLAIYHS